jgi:dolichol-phosphate mannosyltransferase
MLKIILCALNEEENLKKLIVNLAVQLKDFADGFEIIICIDGSNDASFELLTNFQKNYPIKILPIKNVRGLGGACNRVYLSAIENAQDEDLIIYLDSDNTHNPNQILSMLESFKLNNLDVLIASRFCDKSTMKTFPLHRKLISIVASIVLSNLVGFKKISGKKLLDYTSGFRIYKAQKIKKLQEIYGDKLIAEPDFTSTCEIILKLGRLNCRIDEFALFYDYDQKIGKSKLRIFRNSCNLLTLIFKFLFTKKIKKLSK